MTTSYNIKTEHKLVKMHQRACFGSLTHCVANRDICGKILSVTYLPFHCPSIRNQERINISEWGTSKRASKFWWSYLMSKPFFSEYVINNEDFMAGIEIEADIPADRLLITLFMFRLVQENSETVKDFIDLVEYKGIDPDIAFILMFLINSRYTIHRSSDKDGYFKETNQFKIETGFCPESTLIPSSTFSISDASNILNNLLVKDYSLELYKGQQGSFASIRTYSRYESESKKALCRYFSRKTGKVYRTNCLKQVLVHLRPEILGTDRKKLIQYVRGSELILSSKEILKAAEFLTKLKVSK